MNQINLTQWSNFVRGNEFKAVSFNAFVDTMQTKFNEIITAVNNILQNEGGGGTGTGLTPEQAAVVALIALSEKQNLELRSLTAEESLDGKAKNINIEPAKSVKIKPGSGAQIELLADHTGDLSEVLVKVLKSIDDMGADLATEMPVRLRLNSTEVEFNTKDAADVNSYDLKFKTGLKSTKAGDHYCQTKFKGRSFDIRCYEHGGIALQPCGTDSKGKENKIKFEGSRTSELSEAPAYAEEGGKGAEFGTFNSEHASLFCGDYRFKGDAKIYGVTRGALVTTTNESGDVKVDYPTQADDTKDIIDEENGATWNEVIAAVKYLKSQGKI